MVKMSKWRWCYSTVSNAVVILYVFALALWVVGVVSGVVLNDIPGGVTFIPFFLAFFEIHRHVLQGKFDFYVHRFALLTASLCVLALWGVENAAVFSGGISYAAAFAIFAAMAVAAFTVVTRMQKRVAPSPVAMIIFPFLCVSLAIMVIMKWYYYWSVVITWGVLLAAYALFRPRGRGLKGVVYFMPFIMFAGILGLGFLVLWCSRARAC